MAKRPTVALCGAGIIAGAHATAAASLGVEVSAVASRTPERASTLVARVGGRVVRYSDLPAGADIVVVETPPQCHHRDVLQALRAGAAVVVEKPLCTTLEQADEIVALAEASRDRLLYAENLAYAPVVGEFVRRVRALGTLTHLEVRALNPLPNRGGFTDDDWGGGALFDLGVHPLAVAVLAAAPALPRLVQARLEGSRSGRHGTDELAEVVVQFDNGLRARVISSYRGGDTPQWDAQAASETGVVRAELLPQPHLEVNGTEVAIPSPTGKVPALEHYGYRGEWAAFLQNLASGTRPVMDAAFGRMMLDIVCAAYTSARTGAPEATPFTGPRDRTPLQLWRGA